MTDELYWNAQWAILELEEGRARGLLSNTEENVLDILLAVA